VRVGNSAEKGTSGMDKFGSFAFIKSSRDICHESPSNCYPVITRETIKLIVVPAIIYHQSFIHDLTEQQLL
jgi:hypothetical protein